MGLRNATVRRLTAAAAIACAASAAIGCATPALAASGAAPRLAGCNESSAVRPVRYNPVCNDGAYTVVRLSWTSWGGTARGGGEFYDHGRLYPVRLTAWAVRGGEYTQLGYYFPGQVPAGFGRAWTIRYDGHRWHGRVV